MLRAICHAHLLFLAVLQMRPSHILLAHLRVLRPLKPVQQVRAYRAVKVESANQYEVDEQVRNKLYSGFTTSISPQIISLGLALTASRNRHRDNPRYEGASDATYDVDCLQSSLQ